MITSFTSTSCRFTQRSVWCLTDVEKKMSHVKSNESVSLQDRKEMIFFVIKELIFNGTVNESEIDLRKAFAVKNLTSGLLF